MKKQHRVGVLLGEEGDCKCRIKDDSYACGNIREVGRSTQV